MIRFGFILLLLFIKSLYSEVNAQLNNIVIDTTWTSDTIFVSNNIIVESSATLIINPGIFIKFMGNYSIDVYGSIKAKGTKTDSIFFTINDTTGFADTATYAGGWGGIKLLNNISDSSFFSYCKFNYAKAIEPGSFAIDNDNLNLKGGVLYADNYNKIEIHHCLFGNNWANYEGGAICVGNTNMVSVIESEFIENKTLVYGGGTSIYNCEDVLIKGNLYMNNWAYKETIVPIGVAKTGAGGAIHIKNCYPNVIILDNKFYNNKSISGIVYDGNTRTLLINNTLTNNYGSALFEGRGYGTQKYSCNTISYNSNPSGSCAGLIYGNEDLELYNNIFWGNENDPAYPVRREVYGIGIDSQSALSKYNDLKYGAFGEGSIDDYPQFANPTEGAGMEYDGLSADWSLLETSPCINTGTPDTTGLNLPEFDIAGNPRVFGGRIDMGAYENQSVYVKINESPVYSKINVYPNPGNNEIYIDIPPEINGLWIDIVDGQGRVLMHEQIRMSPAMLSPYKLKNGIYYYRIYNENKVIKSGKWVKNAG